MTRPAIRRRVGVLMLALLALSSPACSRQNNALTIYSGRTENLVGPLLERFAREKGVPIDVRYGDSADLALLIAEEGERSPADIFFSQSPGAVGFLAGKGLLASPDKTALEKVDPAFRSKGGHWVGVSGRQRVLVYNSKLVAAADLPESVFDLTGAQYAQKVGIAPQNASFQDFITVMSQVKGKQETEKWLGGMAANKSPVYPNNNAIVAAVARGEVPMGLANHYYNYRFLQEDPDAPSRNHIFPPTDLGSLVLASSVSVVAGSNKAEAANKFVNYLLSPKAQKYFVEQTFEYPLANGSKRPPGLPALGAAPAFSYDLDSLGSGLEDTARLIDKSGLQR